MIRQLLPLFLVFLKRDILILKEEYVSKLLDTAFLFFTNVIVFAYFMPKEGLTKAYGPFLMIGSIASFGLFDVVFKVSKLNEDIEGNRTISFLLTLPLSSTALFIYTGIYWGLHSATFTLPLFILGKILLLKSFDLGAISYWRLIIIYVSGNLFYGFFALWLTGILKGNVNLGSIFLRFINPLFMFGAYYFSWTNAYALDRLIGYAMLINPLVYVMEGMRAATLGQSGYLPFWVTPIILWGFIIALGSHGISRIKRRIDCI